MAEGINAFPLTWPETMPRQKSREKGQFRTTLPGALNNVETSLKAFARDSGKALNNIVMSSNVTLGRAKPEDPGVAVWFVWDGMQVCIPVDRYQSVEANLQAIHHIIEARRVELRHGTLALVRATFTGFMALPAPGNKRAWREILGLSASAPADRRFVEEQFRQLSKKLHPDMPGGSHDAFTELQRAKDEALKEIGA